MRTRTSVVTTLLLALGLSNLLSLQTARAAYNGESACEDLYVWSPLAAHSANGFISVDFGSDASGFVVRHFHEFLSNYSGHVAQNLPSRENPMEALSQNWNEAPDQVPQSAPLTEAKDPAPAAMREVTATPQLAGRSIPPAGNTAPPPMILTVVPEPSSLSLLLLGLIGFGLGRRPSARHYS